MSQYVRPRSVVVSALVATLASIVVGSAFAASIVGTAKNDTLRGTAKADRLLGQAGNDKLYGLGGGDVLTGGPGNDLLVGGPGSDKLACGPGRDTAMADAQDKVAGDCEAIKGVPKPELSVADASMREGNAGVQPLAFSVTLDKASPLPVTVSLATANGTAAGGSDYTAFAGQARVRAGREAQAGDDRRRRRHRVRSRRDLLARALEPRERDTRHCQGDGHDPERGRAEAQGRALRRHFGAREAGRIRRECRSDGTDRGERLRGPHVPRGADHVAELPDHLRGFAALTADWRFTIAVSDTDSDGDTISIGFNGALAVGGPSSGTLRVDILINTSAGP